jgi:excisionase family DNA binding protein
MATVPKGAIESGKFQDRGVIRICQREKALKQRGEFLRPRIVKGLIHSLTKERAIVPVPASPLDRDSIPRPAPYGGWSLRPVSIAKQIRYHRDTECSSEPASRVTPTSLSTWRHVPRLSVKRLGRTEHIDMKQNDLLTAGDVAKLGVVSPATVRTWADSGRLPFFRTAGNVRLFERLAVERFLAARRPTTTLGQLAGVAR